MLIMWVEERWDELRGYGGIRWFGGFRGYRGFLRGLWGILGVVSDPLLNSSSSLKLPMETLITAVIG